MDALTIRSTLAALDSHIAKDDVEGRALFAALYAALSDFLDPAPLQDARH